MKRMRELAPILLSIGFVFLGIFNLDKSNAHSSVSWTIILFFGFCAIALILSKLYKSAPGSTSLLNSTAVATLKSGKDFELLITDEAVTLVCIENKEEKILVWADLTGVFAIAIDAFPVGGLSWVLHKGNDTLEIPWESKNSDVLLTQMQLRLPGFDNEAVIEMSGTLHGFRKIWSKT